MAIKPKSITLIFCIFIIGFSYSQDKNIKCKKWMSKRSTSNSNYTKTIYLERTTNVAVAFTVVNMNGDYKIIVSMDSKTNNRDFGRLNITYNSEGSIGGVELQLSDKKSELINGSRYYLRYFEFDPSILKDLSNFSINGINFLEGSEITDNWSSFRSYDNPKNIEEIQNIFYCFYKENIDEVNKAIEKKEKLESIAQNIKGRDKGFNGIGLFRINNTPETIINYYEYKWDVKLKEIKSTFDASPIEKGVYKLKYDTMNNYVISYDDGSPLNNVNKYYINSIEISGVKISNLFLTFKDSLLVEIRFQSDPEVGEAIRLKYGKGERIKDISKKQTCVYALTGLPAEEKNERHVKTKWMSDNVTAIQTYDSYYDSKCKSVYSNYVEIYEESEKTERQKQEKEILKKNKQNELEEKKEELKGF